MSDRAAALRAGTVPQSANWAASVCYARRAFGHRADIDGLRAVAVVPVLLFHAGFPAFAGGFVGVDVFFVISGYLITSIILDETDAGRFSIFAFYERRIRRIFPALFAMLFASSILGALVLLPDDLKNLGQSSAAAALSASNFLFWHESGYFDVAAELKPLLHTWSLAVEEQFYVVFPIALLLLLRAHKSGALLILATVALLSFVLAEWGPSPMAFYLAPARAWELLLGALLATGAVPPPGRQWVRDSLSLLGLGLIAWSVLALSSATPFPGMAALLPTLGAALVIHAGDGGQSLAGRVLGVRPLVLAGLISYSLYLWHWPLLVFARTYVGRELSMAETLAVLALSVAVAVASWRWIERPFRGSRPILARPKLFAVAGAAVSVTVAIGLGLHLAEGLPTRLPPDAARLAAGASDRAIAPPGCVNPPLEAVREGRLCRIGAEGPPRPTFLLWGDSHAGMLGTAISDVAARNGRAGLFAGLPGCPPLLGVNVLARDGAILGRCLEANEAVLGLVLRDRNVGTVVLAAHWSLYATGVRLGRPMSDRVWLDDTWAGPGTSPTHEAAFRHGLERIVAELAAAGKRVIVVGPVPEVNSSVPWSLALAAWRGRSADIRPTLAEFEARNRTSLSVLAELAGRGLARIIYPEVALCDEARCRVESEGRALYSDDNHLSLSGAEVVGRLLEGIL